MQTEYIELYLVLGNGEKCKVRYWDWGGSPMYKTRTIPFEFFGSFAVSGTGYRRESRNVDKEKVINPEEAARQIIEKLTGIMFNGVNVQQRLL